MMVCCPGHLQGQTRLVSSWDFRANTLELNLPGNRGVLQCASWIPAAGAGDEACSRSGVITHLCGVGMVSLGMVRYTCAVSLWKTQGGALLGCCYPSDWLWCCCTLLLLHLLWNHELLIKQSLLSHLATSFLLLSTKVDLALDEEQGHKHLLPLDRG